ncbi:mucin-13-like [Xiphophorus hellerii]|uniref:mucin-13-like n=1 Tax=Xiphophorus hellerii TaxID=8084 RepID=UPI0013B3BA3E|nr:mucin-13-like [Xiphophorus hellerii]
MAKTLIVTFLLCIAVTTVATEETILSITTKSPTPTPTTEVATATTTPPTPTPTTEVATATTTPPTPTPTTEVATATTTPPTPTPTTKVTTTTTTPPTPTPTTKVTTTTTTPPTSTPTTKVTTTTTTPPTSTPTTKVTTTTTTPPTPTPTTKVTTTTTTLVTPTPASTGTPPTEGSSVSPNTGSSQTNAPSTAPVPTTPKPPSACASNPCRDGSTCEERFNQNFACLCLPGDVYDSSFCLRAKVFPGLLVLNRAYDDKMADKTSEIFSETAGIITDAIEKQFSGQNNGYIKSLVLELRENKPNARSQTKSGNIEASIEIIYEPTAEITQDTVKETMGAITCTGCALEGSFTEKSLCDSNSCDTLSTKCSSTGGSFTCSCDDGFIKSNYSDRLCMAACPVGQIYVNNGCKDCDFGYIGFNCKDNRLLIVVIICSILGALVIAALIALPLVVTKSKKKSSKTKEEDIGIPYQSHSIAKAPLSSSNGNSKDFSASVKEPTNSLANSGAPRIPRATANSNWDSRTNLEMTPSNSRQNLIPSGMNSRFNDNQDDMYSYSQNRPKNHPYEEIQPKSNPYSQNRASNPYAQIRGQTNPYFN